MDATYQHRTPGGLLATLSFAAALLGTASHGHAGTLYAAGQVFGEVYTIDTTTGVATLVGTPGVTNMHCIAFDDEGVLHGLEADFLGTYLWELDPDADTATFIGSTGSTSIEGGMTYDPSTDLFYSKWQVGTGSTSELITIDPVTGLGTVIGSMGVSDLADINGLTFLPDGTLLAFDGAFPGPSSLLHEVDPSTGVTTEIGPTGEVPNSGVGGLAYDPDTEMLYMSNAVELWSIDPTTGEGTLIGPHGIVDLVVGLSVLPDPEPSCLIGLDLTSTLFDVDPESGYGTNARVLGEAKFGGLARSGAGELYGMRAAPIPELYSIDQPSGVATLIGPLGILHSEGGLDFDPGSGELFGVGGVSELFTIDTTTGAATIVGPLVDELGDPIDPSAVAFDDAGNLFVLKAASAPPEIYQVDPTDATVLDRVPLPGLPLDFFGGMDFDDSTGFLYLSYGGVLYRANPYTGATIPLGPTPARSALEVIGPCDPPRRRIRKRRQIVFPWSG